jgi:hypothetical protein
MTLAETMRILRAKGKLGAAAVYRRHGVIEPTVGLSYADLGVMVKRIGVDDALALRLWDAGLHDARVLGTKVAGPAQLTKATLATWLKGCTNLRDHRCCHRHGRAGSGHPPAGTSVDNAPSRVDVHRGVERDRDSVDAR